MAYPQYEQKQTQIDWKRIWNYKSQSNNKALQKTATEQNAKLVGVGNGKNGVIFSALFLGIILIKRLI